MDKQLTARSIKRLSRGFTIVEVMMVLAVAGLIMAIIFFAVPQLERTQRDSQRKSIALRVKSELETFASNTEGSYPFAGVGNTAIECNGQGLTPANGCGYWFTNYIGTSPNYLININDPSSGTGIHIYYDNDTSSGTPAPSTWTPGDEYIIVGAKCSGTSVVSSGALGSISSKQYAIQTELETPNNWACFDNF